MLLPKPLALMLLWLPVMPPRSLPPRPTPTTKWLTKSARIDAKVAADIAAEAARADTAIAAGDAATLAAAKTYADGLGSSEVARVDAAIAAGDAATLTAAKAYTDAELADEVTRVDAKIAADIATSAAADAALLSSAISSEVTRVDTKIANDVAANSAADRAYTDAAITSEVARVDSKIAADISGAIGNLDLSNSAQLAANIAGRDALVLTKNSFVLVSDATGDATVTAGAALYFYNTGDSSFLKIAEYESLDIVIPNKAILEQFSDVSGQLAYKGALVGTVQEGAHAW
jgi:hypothetical protein